MRVVVAMSGGVDSSAAAALLAAQGHEVLGIALRLRDASDPARGRSCCGPDDLDDARATARALGIPFYVADAEAHFGRAVVEAFVDDYLRGRTPNPCVACNTEVKFDWLLRRARALGARLATGHYARVERRAGRLALLAARHPEKDQSYFLHGLGQEALADVLFPVGQLSKPEVRDLAERAGLPTARKPESQEICFVTRGSAAGFVARRAPDRVRRAGGDHLGRGRGSPRRRPRFHGGPAPRRGAAGAEPRYVVRPRPRGRVVVGSAAEASRAAFLVRAVNWVAGLPPAAPRRLLVRVRHRHAGEQGLVRPEGDGASVELERPVRGIAPGQSAVFYDGDEVVGGGRIV
jgi:tRNA-specific 2-thiouridylase